MALTSGGRPAGVFLRRPDPAAAARSQGRDRYHAAGQWPAARGRGVAGRGGQGQGADRGGAVRQPVRDRWPHGHPYPEAGDVAGQRAGRRAPAVQPR
ncbi:hypothetical protein G6F35_018318 [Rhizopus arrhizus]|nr:hypothetical protein G6F35_018318 [Rhizopus arrhizus]